MLSKQIFHRQEGWNSGIRNYPAQKRIDAKRVARKKRYAKSRLGNSKWGDYVKYRGVY